LLTGGQQDAATDQLLTGGQQDAATRQLLTGVGVGQQDVATRQLLTGGQQDTATRQLLTGGQHDAATRQLLGAADQEDAATRQLLSESDQSQHDAATQQLLRSSHQDQATRRLLAGSLQDSLHDDASRHLLGAGSRKARKSLEQASEPTCFRVVVNGEIESAQLGNCGPLLCVFSFQHGADWTTVAGAPNGVTQLACSAAPTVTSLGRGGGCQREVVWNFPIGIVFKSTSPFGWPRIVISVYGTDMCNRRVIKGYGSVHIPCQPGRHSRVIRLYRPISSSPLQRLLGALFGNTAQLVDPRVVAGTEGREVIRVQSGGRVRVLFEVLLKDTEIFNYTF